MRMFGQLALRPRLAGGPPCRVQAFGNQIAAAIRANEILLPGIRGLAGAAGLVIGRRRKPGHRRVIDAHIVQRTGSGRIPAADQGLRQVPAPRREIGKPGMMRLGR